MKLKEDSFIRWDLGFIVQKNMSPVKNPYHSRDRFCNYELQDLDFFYPESIKKRKTDQLDFRNDTKIISQLSDWKNSRRHLQKSVYEMKLKQYKLTENAIL